MEAIQFLEHSVNTYESARLAIAAKGLDRADFGVFNSPYPFLGAMLLHVNQPMAAWTVLEADLARGLLDELGVKTRTQLTPAEDAQRQDLNGKLQALEPRLLKLVSAQKRTSEERAELEMLLRERNHLSSRLAKLAAEISKRELASLVQVQKALAADAAWVAWLDVTDGSGPIQSHWVCVLRATGEPHWEKVPSKPRPTANGPRMTMRRQASSAAS